MNKVVIRVVLLLLVGAGAVAGAYFYKVGQTEAVGARLLDEALADLAAVEVDGPGRAYIEGLARRYHAEAAARAFNSGGELTGGTYDANVYQRVLIDSIIAHARRDGATAVADALEAFKSNARLELLDPLPPG